MAFQEVSQKGTDTVIVFKISKAVHFFWTAPCDFILTVMSTIFVRRFFLL